jgi:ribosomal 50S subunit-recycling heat shock protein
VRLDKFLQVSRLVRRREVANMLCDRGRVRVNGSVARPAALVHTGDVITISRGDRRLVAKVLYVPDRPTPSKDLVDILARINLDEFRELS